MAAAEPDEQLADSVNKTNDVETKDVKEEIEVTVRKAKSNREKGGERKRFIKYYKKLGEVKLSDAAAEPRPGHHHSQD